MKHLIKHTASVAAFLTLASVAHAECSVEYKAKQDNPLRLEHGTMIVPGSCAIEDVTPLVASALSEKGWTLLKVLSVSENQ